MTTPSDPPADAEVDKPHVARIWNYWQGGTVHFAVDREVGDHMARLSPQMRELALAQKAFLARVTRTVATAGVRQFLDVGTGFPTDVSIHGVAQGIAPESRVVYVDHDPLVLTHGRELLAGSPPGAADYVLADVRDPERILREAGRTLDPSRPTAVFLLGILAHVVDDAEAMRVVRTLLDAVPSGSYLAVCDSTEVFDPVGRAEQVRQWNASGREPRINRSPARIERFFDGLELLAPGVVPVPAWRPDPLEAGPVNERIDSFGGVARVP